MPNIYSTITLVNGNFYAASEQQWRKGGANSPPSHHWFLFCFKLWPTDTPTAAAFAQNYLKCNSATALMNENLYATSEEQWRKKGSKFPPNQWIFHFPSFDFLRASIFSQILPEVWQRNLINEILQPLPLNNSRGWIWDSRRNVGLNPPELLRFSFLNCDLPTNSVRIACNQAEISRSQTGPLRL